MFQRLPLERIVNRYLIEYTIYKGMIAPDRVPFS
ncbi:unknown [Porphyromonas sp. CAG:1061]|nr:unknown [Porphyromonas sp. CAG:1061]